jgi:hypothetical protein
LVEVIINKKGDDDMGLVIGAATSVSFTGCATSVNWGASPNSQRLYCLGSWSPYIVIAKPTATLSITVYAPGPSYSTVPTTGCANANTIGAGVSPGACGGGGGEGVSGNWYVTSYSYSKDDATMPGTESWSMQQWIGGLQPSYVMRGVTEGQGSPGSGVNFSSVDGSTSTGSVSAGGFGRADTLNVGVVVSVGGGSSSAGATGQGSASMSYTDLYI